MLFKMLLKMIIFKVHINTCLHSDVRNVLVVHK